jgi:hypothetical protein
LMLSTLRMQPGQHLGHDLPDFLSFWATARTLTSIC